MKKYVITLFVMIFLLPTLLVAQINTSTHVLLPGESITVSCNTELSGTFNRTSATLTCANIITPTSTMTSTTIVLTYIPTLPTFTPTSSPSNTPVIPAGNSLWITPQELQSLPMSGDAWIALENAAKGSWGTADLSNQDSNHDVLTLAGALYYARTSDTSMRNKVKQALLSIPETENGGRTLALGRNLVSYVIAADLIQFQNDIENTQWSTWLRNVRTEVLDGRTLISTHEQRPNNWGTHAGASRIAASLYLKDTTDIERAVKVFHGWLGNRNEYAGFVYGDLDWQCDTRNPVGINLSCVKNGLNIDGALPDDMRRGGTVKIPPEHTEYAWGGLHGAVIQAELLHNAGYDVWNWQDKALYRAGLFLKRLDTAYGGWKATGDDTPTVYLLNNAYQSTFDETYPAKLGKAIAWTDYTHNK